MLLDARFYVDAFGHVRMYAHKAGEWIVVDWPWVLASLSTDRRWTVHSTSMGSYATYIDSEQK